MLASVIKQHTSLKLVFSTLASSVLASWQKFNVLLYCMQELSLTLTSICTLHLHFCTLHLPQFARDCQSGRGRCCLNRPRKTFAHLTPKLSRSASIQSCVAKITFCLFLVARFHAWHRFKYLISDSIHIQILFHIYIFNRNLFHLTA